MGYWAGAVIIAGLATPLAVVAVTSKPGTPLFRAATWTLTRLTAVNLALTTVMLIRGPVDAGAATVLAATALAAFATASINARRLNRWQAALRSRPVRQSAKP